MTWQDRLFEIAPTLTASLGSVEVPLEIKGESVKAEDGDVFEVKVYIRVSSNTVGHTKMTDIGDFTGDLTNDRKALIVKAFTELVRHVPAEEWEDMRHRELLVRHREAAEAAGVTTLKPKAV